MTKSTLKKYSSKRDFEKTPEPSGRKARSTKKIIKSPTFVIQKHDASHLHYDFRLENNGVLVSWAVPKGIPKTTSEKRLAIRTEDHPLEYAHFAGTIPAGEYGAGTVQIWDHGTYESLFNSTDTKNPITKDLKKGKIEIVLDGSKAHGSYALIKRSGSDNTKEQWLLIKMKKRSHSKT